MKLFQKSEKEKNKEYKVKTKGKFPEYDVKNPGDHFRRDISWIQKANPEAALQEKNYYVRDYEILDKKR